MHIKKLVFFNFQLKPVCASVVYAIYRKHQMKPSQQSPELLQLTKRTVHILLT